MNSKTKRITVIGMLCAITYVTMVVGRIPIILFLKYDPSDVIVTLGGFIWGPMTSCIVSVIVATLEMITVSDTGILGCIMNIVQTLSFACTASVIYFIAQQQSAYHRTVGTPHLVTVQTDELLLLLGQITVVFIAEELVELRGINRFFVRLVPLGLDIPHRVLGSLGNGHRVVVDNEVCERNDHALTPSVSLMVFCLLNCASRFSSRAFSVSSSARVNCR